MVVETKPRRKYPMGTGPHGAKSDRNRKVAAYQAAHPGVSLAAMGRMFHLSRQAVRGILDRERARVSP